MRLTVGAVPSSTCVGRLDALQVQSPASPSRPGNNGEIVVRPGRHYHRPDVLRLKVKGPR